jgi:phage terminase large subunit
MTDLTKALAQALGSDLQNTPQEKFSARQREAMALIEGPERHVMLCGGARSGKTFLITRAIVARALKAAGSRHAILRFRSNAARSSISLDTLPSVMRLSFPGAKIEERRHDSYFELPNGSQIWIGGLEDADRVEKILGLEFATVYLNECSQIAYSSVLIALTRLAQNIGLVQKCFFDLNPTGKGHWSNLLFGEKRDPRTRQQLAKSRCLHQNVPQPDR